jgi:hypothetical protein
MEAMRNSWTDERLDDGFERVHADIALLRRETREEFKSLRGEIGSLRTETQDEAKSLREEMHRGFDGLHRTLLQVGGGIIAALIGVIATQL